jgi:uncharacterized protein YndB with AHSA1/START domain
VENRSLGPRVDFSGFEQSVARIEADIDVSPEDVFLALIEPARLERWIATKATVEPEVGGRYDFGWDHGPMMILSSSRPGSWRTPGSGPVPRLSSPGSSRAQGARRI